MASIKSKKIHRKNYSVNHPVIGVDAALGKTGVCVLEKDIVHLFLIQTKKLRGAKRLSFIADSLEKIISEFDELKLGVVEGGAFGGSGRIFQLGQAQGVTQVEIFRRGASVLEASPTQLKKYFTGVSSASKKLMVETATDILGISSLEEDLADAFAAASLADAILEENPKTRKQAEVILKMKEQKKALS